MIVSPQRWFNGDRVRANGTLSAERKLADETPRIHPDHATLADKGAITVNPDLARLIRLQEIDLKIQGIQDRIKAIPQETEHLNHTIEECRRELEQAQHGHDNAQSERRQLEIEVEDLRQKCTKSKTQLMEVKSNREYKAVLQEISATEDKIGQKEDEVLELMLAGDEWEEKVAQAEKTLSEKEQQIAEKRNPRDESHVSV